MCKRIRILWVLILCHLLFIPGVCSADETDLFSYSANPDALILLDLSGSMALASAGNYMYTDSTSHCSSNTSPFYNDPVPGYTAPCDFSQTWSIPVYADAGCVGPFYIKSASPYTTDCSRLGIAKRGIFGILDADKSGTVNSNDETSLKVRIGYMNFFKCEATESTVDSTSACHTLIAPIPNNDPPPFTSPTTPITPTYSNIWSKVTALGLPSGATPLTSALKAIKQYLDAHKAADSAKDCRQKFAIMITDGEDTIQCSGDKKTSNPGSRRNTVYQVDALAKAGYKTFVIGLGAHMPDQQINTLNWAAKFGGTNNPSDPDTGDITKITPSNSCDTTTTNDPGVESLRGYAFFATDTQSLADALSRAFDYINNTRVSFTASTVAAFRTTADNYLYQASFQPVNGDPFYLGHLQKYNINSDGSAGSMVWDAATSLQSRDYSTRKIYTLISGALTPFTHSSGIFGPPGQAKAYLGVGTGNQAMAVVGYIEGDPTYNPDGWYLGDIFHSNVMSIGSPNPFFNDSGFANFRSNIASRAKILVVGANDGQLHAFSASDGSELWSFIPPNQLPRLAFISHQTDPTTLAHRYFVDGGMSAADVWLGSGDGTTKSSSDWHTLLVFGEGQGVRDSLNQYPIYQWSSSSTCDSQNPTSDFTKAYDSGHPYYCGYLAFDVTDTSANPPVFKWHLNFPTGGPQTQLYLGEPWSKISIGRVKISGNEKWVGFIGGGYATEADRGKGIFVVDLSDGHVLWSYTKADNSGMGYVVPASPAIVDTDNDGFIDTAYVGDLGGNMWRLKFCTQKDTSSCNTGNWSGSLLFQASSGLPIYSSATVARDTNSLWVLWGTGDRENPLSTSGQNRFFAVKDSDRTATYNIGSLQNISAQGTTFTDTGSGWYITLAGSGEKVLADPTVFGGIVLFTTYTPDTLDTNPCNRIGIAKLYGLAMMQVAISGIYYNAGAGVLSTPSDPSSKAGGARSVTLGSGLAKEPVVSQKPVPGGSTDLYISVSGGAGVSTSIVTDVTLGSMPLTDRLKTTAASTKMIHWKDGRLQ